jgi:ABC-type uncharacterized transport system permease subunit
MAGWRDAGWGPPGGDADHDPQEEAFPKAGGEQATLAGLKGSRVSVASTFSPCYGFGAIAPALMGGGHSPGVVLTALLSGNCHPFGANAPLIFGLADSLQVKMQILQTPVPTEFLQMAPYIVTMIALAGVVGRVHAPVADGKAYEK